MTGSWEPFGAARRLSEEPERAGRRAAKRAAEAAHAQPAPVPRRHMRREPVRKLVVITCMDARIDPLAMLGLQLGDAAVIRNAGATVSDDVLRSLRLSQSVLGTRRALLIGHTDCAAYASDTAASAALADGLRRIRGAGGLPDGFGLEAMLYDVRGGTLSTVA